MKANIYFDPTRDRYEIRIVDFDRHQALTHKQEWVSFEPGEVAPVFITLTPFLYEAIMKEALNLGLPNRPDELQDCRKVRDRLLTLVEQVVGGDHP
jgi:hypothetical protein